MRSTLAGCVSFCSNRYSNGGCGRTFPVYWEGVAPGCSIRLRALLAFIRPLARGEAVLRSWRESEFPLSASSAYRWTRRWRLNTSHIRAALYRLRAPPPEGDTSADLHTLRHLDSCFAGQSCALAAFQSEFDAPVFPH